MVHKHPSGDPTASRDDLDVTREITAALATLGIAVHDDAIVARNKLISLRRRGAVWRGILDRILENGA